MRSCGCGVGRLVLVLACHTATGDLTDAAKHGSIDALPDKLSIIPSLGVSAGLFFSCAVRDGGSAACWGYGENGTLGDGSTADSVSPRPVVDISGALALSASEYDACVLGSDRTVACWGDDFDGELGDNGMLAVSSVPVTVENVTDAVQVAIGGIGCALRANTTVDCWGGPVLGGDFRAAPVPDLVGAIALAPTTAFHECAIMNDGTVRCWGRDDAGQLGDGSADPTSSVPRTTPVVVPGIGSAIALATGVNDSYALLGDSTVLGWGENDRHQIGSGSDATVLTPSPVPDLTGVVQLSAGDGYACATRFDGTAWCWGDNTAGELGNGTTTSSSIPVASLRARERGVSRAVTNTPAPG